MADYGGKGGANLAASNVFFAHITARVHQMIIQQWHAATTIRHSLIHTHVSVLTDLQMFDYRPRIASRYSVRTFSYFEQLTS